MSKCTDCPTCGETLHAMGDEERAARFAEHADYLCHNEGCEDCGETFTQDRVDSASDSKSERAFEREQAGLMSSPPESYESLQSKARLLK